MVSASFDWLSVKPLSATLEACLSSESGIQSFTAIKVAKSSSAAITLLGLDFENAQGARDLSTSRENHGPWQPGTISRNPPTHARPSSALASVKKDKPSFLEGGLDPTEKDLQHGGYRHGTLTALSLSRHFIRWLTRMGSVMD